MQGRDFPDKEAILNPFSHAFLFNPEQNHLLLPQNPVGFEEIFKNELD